MERPDGLQGRLFVAACWAGVLSPGVWLADLTTSCGHCLVFLSKVRSFSSASPLPWACTYSNRVSWNLGAVLSWTSLQDLSHKLARLQDPSRNLRWINVLLGMWGNCGWQVHGLFQGVVAPAAPRYILGIFFGNVWGRLAYACTSMYFNDSLIFNKISLLDKNTEYSSAWGEDNSLALLRI